MGGNIGGYSERHVKIRTIAAGSKTIDAGDTKHLEIDSGTNGAEILSIEIKGVNSADWKLELYIPTADAVSAPAAEDKREELTWSAASEAGLIPGIIGIPYNMFLDFTNNAGAPDDIDEVIVKYRSKDPITVEWEA